MSSISTSNVTSGFIDLATFDEIEKYLYGGHDATAYFVRETRKATWFTQVPVVLSRAAGSPGFGQEWSVAISRAGDYMLQTWLRLSTPAVKLNATNQITADGTTYRAAYGRLRWTRNFMHNIIRECSITFNDLIAARFDSYHLDFWAAFTVPESKRNGYNNMIGNVDELIQPHIPGDEIAPTTLNLPLPFFYSRDSGVALPTAALPYNEMRINFYFRDWEELLILQAESLPMGPGNGGTVTGNAPNVKTGETRVARVLASDLSGGAPVLGSTQVWANYAIVSNDERKRMACAPRDILIEQVQTAPKQTFVPTTNDSQSFDIRFSHAIKVLFFAVKNITHKAEHSIYHTASPRITLPATTAITYTNTDPAGTVNFSPAEITTDPIRETSLIYENTNRLAAMGSDYFSLVNPWYHAPAIPTDTGYHSYSYSLDFISLDPMGSTNYGKLTNVSIVPVASKYAVTVNGPQGDTAAVAKGTDFKQTFEFIVTAINNNIIRVSGGALGFPVL
uniref:Major capsid protein N-terminal domain-containing protein n=1 Tax=viral metagenome TaxID=1070528 RepID=A0A6C0H3E2_9ZZZZ